MESWRRVFREAVCPNLPTEGLQALRDALASDDSRLLQGCTTSPPPLECVTDWPCEGADAIGFAFWRGSPDVTVGEVEAAFAEVAFRCDELLNDYAVIRWWTVFWDETPRDEMLRELLPEVDRELSRRGVAPAAARGA